MSPDLLKDNLGVYLNEYRMVGDALDILDARVINYRVTADIIVMPNSNKLDVVSAVIQSLSDLLSINNFQIGQPINLSDIMYAIINVQGVLSLVKTEITNIRGTVLDREYSSSFVDMNSILSKGNYFATPGDIFELRYPDNDIIINVQ
jgi:phage-related baseplate assembly protein